MNDTNEHCEQYEVEISALIDGELAAAEAMAVTDHMMACAACRDFYRMVRGIDQTLAEARLSAKTGDLPVGLWTRIDSAAGPEQAAAPVVDLAARRSLPAWVWKVAATILVLVGVWSLARLWVQPGESLGDALQVRLESDQGALDDARFIEMTTELLRADRRYHRKMLEIMGAVASHTVGAEGSPEPLPLPPLGNDLDAASEESDGMLERLNRNTW